MDAVQIERITDLSEADGWIEMQRSYLHHACQRHHDATGHWVDPESELEKTVETIGKCLGADGRFLTARDPGGALLGMVLLHRLQGGKAEVKRLFIDPAARGRGIARRLMARIETEARAMGCSALYLDTTVGLHEAIALYRALGFTDADFDTESVQDPEIARHLVFLEKPL
jgi:GNAT superfamily N-acetyltransferase